MQCVLRVQLGKPHQTGIVVNQHVRIILHRFYIVSIPGKRGCHVNPVCKKIHKAEGAQILALFDMLIQIGRQDEKGYFIILPVRGSMFETLLGRTLLTGDHAMIRKINHGEALSAFLEEYPEPPE